MNIIETDAENHTVTAEIPWYELDYFINEYDKIAGRFLRENDLVNAMYWVNRSKELRAASDKVTESL
jgi:adenosine deaminase